MRLGIQRRDKLSWGDVQDAGTFDGWRFIRFRDDVFVVDQTPLADVDAVAPLHLPDGELRIIEPVTEMQFGTPTHRNLTWRAKVTTEAELERYRRRGAPAEPKPTRLRPVDLIAATRLGSARPERVMPRSIGFGVRVTSAEALTALDAEQTIRRDGDPVYVRAARGPVHGAEAILRRIRGQGADVVLSADGDALLVAPRGRIPSTVIELFDVAKPLLVAYLAGGSLPCGVSAHTEPAVTIVAGGVPWCGQCAAASDAARETAA